MSIESRKLGLVDFRRMNREAETILHGLGADIPGKKLVRDLNVAAQQMVEIVDVAGLSRRDQPLELQFQRGQCLGVEELPQLPQFLLQLVQCSPDAGPVEVQSGGAILHAQGPTQGLQAGRKTEPLTARTRPWR